jgi:hypothetical protein
MIILGIDPGSEQSAWCLYDTEKQLPIEFSTDFNSILAAYILGSRGDFSRVVCEMIACYGMAVGESIFETCTWIGSFRQACRDRKEGVLFDRIKRKEVVTQLCGSARAKDANVRQVLIDRFGKPGTKKCPGVLYKMKKDEWAALAVAVVYSEINSFSSSSLQ